MVSPVSSGRFGVSFVMLHMHHVVVGLGEAARDRLGDSKKAVEQGRAEERVCE